MIKPVHDNLLVKVDLKQVETKTQSGLILSTDKKDPIKQNTGTVIAIGEGRLLPDGRYIESSAIVGEKIMFNAFAGIEIIDENEDLLLLLKENDILAILE